MDTQNDLWVFTKEKMRFTDPLWEGLLALTQRKTNFKAWTYHHDQFTCYVDTEHALENDASAWLLKDEVVVDYLKGKEVKRMTLPIEGLTLLYKATLPQRVLQDLVLYWPLAVIGHLDRKKPLIFVHVAASLDGKIATVTGDSKWIGNDENLHHAHKLRALMDGILIGANTVKNDFPTLNVRKVKGHSPSRFIISNRSTDFSGLQDTSNTQSFLIRNKAYQQEELEHNFDGIIYYDSFSKVADCLAKGNIRTLLIEGGSQTISSFLEHGLVDILQIHYSPILLGSGKSIAELPLVQKINEALQLHDSIWTQVGDSFMVTCRIC